jgi:hypothetical protein
MYLVKILSERYQPFGISLESDQFEHSALYFPMYNELT